MSLIQQTALGVDAEFTAGSPFVATFAATDAGVVFSSPVVTYRTRGGDLVSGDRVPAVTVLPANVLACSWSAACSAANNTGTGRRSQEYLFEVRALVNGAGPFPIYGGQVTVWPFGVATQRTATGVGLAGTVNVGGVTIEGTVLSGNGRASGVQITDVGMYYTSTDVEAALQEAAVARIAGLATKADADATTTALGLKADAAATTTALGLKANIASPAFTGNPTAPTPAAADNDTSVATSAFVQAELAAQTLRQLRPSQLGAVDDGPTLNAFFAAAGRMFLPPGTYAVTTPLVMVSNSQLFARGVTIVNNTTGTSTRFLTIEGRQNIRIEGLTLNGNKAAFAAATEQRHGIFCRSSSNVEFIDVTSNDNKGDGFYFGGDNNSTKCSIVRLHNCIGSGNHRMGLTLISVEDFHDVGGWYGNSSGTSPQAGCDIEPNVVGDTNARITFTGTSFVNNVWDGVRISPKETPTAKQAGVTFDGCWFDNNGRAGLVLYFARQVQVNGGSISGNAGRGVYTEGGFNEDITLSGTVIANNGDQGFDLDSPFRNLTLIGCTIIDNNVNGGTVDAIEALPVSPSSGLTIIGGRIAGAGHRFGVRTGGNVTNLTIIGTNLTGNASGPLSLADDVATRRLIIANDRIFTARTDPTTEMVFGTRGAGDVADRFAVRGDGTLLWGPGSAAADCRIDRVAPNTLAVGGGDALRLGATTTAARPAPGTVGAGAMMWDTTLSKMIVSNGTAWEVVNSA
jgi:hypothetical protein